MDRRFTVGQARSADDRAAADGMHRGECTEDNAIARAGDDPRARLEFTRAVGVVLTDTLPDLIDYLSDDAGCAYDAMQHALTCELGDIAPGSAAAVTIFVAPGPIEDVHIIMRLRKFALAYAIAVWAIPFSL